MALDPRSVTVRTAAPAVLVALAAAAWLGTRESPAQSAAGWPSQGGAAQAVGRVLVIEHPSALAAATRPSATAAFEALSGALGRLGVLMATRDTLPPDQVRSRMAAIDAGLEDAVRRLYEVLAGDPGARDIGAAPGRLFARVEVPYGSGVLLLKRETQAGAAPEFLYRRVEVGGAAAPAAVELPGSGNLLAAVEVANVPAAGGRFELELRAAGRRLATVDLETAAPPRFPVTVSVRDGAGRPTEAAIGFYSEAGDFLVPETALDFSAAGFYYAPVRYRSHHNARFWPGGARRARCFFVRGGFRMDLPAGTYRLIASKGPEHVPVDETFTVSAAAGRTLRLEPWTDMSAKGWHSGDCHIHYARPRREANARLLLWARAEDLRMGNILRMGDARETYFEQYAFGPRGRVVEPGIALVPGQEDPRTRPIGHTISLNLLAPVRDTDRYYVYGPIFDQVRRQGGLTGYAHVWNDQFSVHRDMSVNVPRGKVDFAEICEFGAVGTDLYYEFLNLGYRLTAAGGSDSPWGGSAGDARTYVYTGKPFQPDDWYRGLRAGRTFVTTGPMLEFSVNGRGPGEGIEIPRGRTLRIRARSAAGYAPATAAALEIVANGNVIRSAPPGGGSAELAFELPAGESMWIAARTTGAHTTPVYVTVGRGRHWNRAAVPGLLEKREAALREIEGLLAAENPVAPGRAGNYENAYSLRAGAALLREAIGEARREYGRLRADYEAGR